MDEAEEQFILGVIASEGTFYGAIDDWETGISVTPSFSFRMSSERDDNLLRTVHEETGIGRLETHDGMTGWVVSNKNDAQDLVEWIENRSSRLWEKSDKSQAFNEWKKIVRLLKGYTKSDWKKVKAVEIATNMNRSKGRGKGTQYWRQRCQELYG